MIKLPQTWTTRDGREIKIREMEDSHLLNTIHYLRRRNHGPVFRAALCWSMDALTYASTAPDGASLAAEEAASGFMRQEGRDEILAEALPSFAALLKEADRRGLSTRQQRVEHVFAPTENEDADNWGDV